MGKSHAKAYQKHDGFEIVGVVSRTSKSREAMFEELGESWPGFDDYEAALAELKPDAVSINTFPDTHAAYAIAAMKSGAHVFLEKPIAETVEEAAEVVQVAKETGRSLVVGYILRVHPSWKEFVNQAHQLGKPLVMRMNLNQQSHGDNWQTHKNIMASLPPMVDCGVHYVDVMCQMTRSRPVRVSAIEAKLSNEVGDQCNYGQMQIVFEDGSVGWYEAGWGPMMSNTAHFVKDVVGPEGSVSIKAEDGGGADSDDVDAHTRTEQLLVHRAELNDAGAFATPDRVIDLEDEPGHDDLCFREQKLFLQAIRGEADMSEHLDDALNSLRIVLAAQEAASEGRCVAL
tara:strand:- start:599 stop:1627 length:1029 start_codon:yes stop_codon:yes gene_type:complete